MEAEPVAKTKKSWKYEVIYSAYAPVEKTVLGLLTDARLGLDEWASKPVRPKESAWFAEDYHQVLEYDLAKQKEAIRLLIEAIEPAGHQFDEVRGPSSKFTDTILTLTLSSSH